jgi:ribosomal protein L11 methyltransferase
LRTLRIEAHQLTKAEADLLVREFSGQIKPAKPLTAKELEPEPRPPLRIRKKLTVVGSAKEHTAEIKAGHPCLFIPATVAFGTGEHATTATCLRLLVDIARTLPPGWEALDLGTGSGILALAAKLLGAGRVEAADFDATAIRVARENAKANSIRGIVFRRFDVTQWQPSRTWPLVLANVYGPILIEAAPRIASAVAKGGHLILSGILREQTDSVLAAFRAQGLRLLRRVAKGKWVTCLAGK